ncbi:MAG: NAD(P)/FAD-dependent oxidoreductase [Ruminococcaceae bacterium]|nr:NAD(P)/FAD-dependent oxidoreductase [Oscillospiraceae bacterium]
MTKKGTEGIRVAVIGGGAAGMMAALTAARAGATVTLYEKNDRLGKKLRITGKGRCNLTNNCDLNEFLSNVPTNPRFLYASLSRFSTADTISFFEEAGVPLKTERGKRVFPVSDRAGDIVAALDRRCRAAGVCIRHDRVTGLLIEDGCACGVRLGSSLEEADAVIVCTGGRSYPMTGSDGDGYRFASAAGHTVTPLSPSLVPLLAKGKLCPSLQGLSLKNVALCVKNTATGKSVYEDFGEMLFTHYGLTGPMILSASAHLSDVSSGGFEAIVDLKPALDEKTLDARLRADFAKYQNRDLINALDDLLPQKMIAPLIGLCEIDPRKKVHSVTREERERMVKTLKGIRIPLCGHRPLDEAIITRGGVSVKEIDPKTMASRIVRGLYFAGEILDVDAYTGGFNLQIAFSTAVAAGLSAAYGEA